MKTVLYRVVAVAILLLSVSACQSVQPESAMQWMQRQPVFIDP
jgi:hypothetical protein